MAPFSIGEQAKIVVLAARASAELTGGLTRK